MALAIPDDQSVEGMDGGRRMQGLIARGDEENRLT